MVAVLLGGCGRPMGDLGRAEPNFVSDVALPAAGRSASSFTSATKSSGCATSSGASSTPGAATTGSPMSPWSCTAPAFSHAAARPAPIDRYYARLHAAAYQSSSVRYGALADDVEADIATLPESFAAICAVQQVDRQREAAAANLPDVGGASRANIAARRADNQDQIDWFVHAVRYRYDAYNYALDHLLVETPDSQAKAVDAELADLGQGVERAERGAFCGRADPASPASPDDARGAVALRHWQGRWPGRQARRTELRQLSGFY